MITTTQWRRRILKGFGFANIFLSLVGFLILIVMAAAFLFIPHDFLTGNFSFFGYFFTVMVICNLIFLISLFITGWLLLKGSLRAVLFCNILFVVELVYFYSLQALSGIPGSQFSPSVVVAMGIGNAGMLTQALPIYPIAALLGLNAANLMLKETASDNGPSVVPVAVSKTSLGIGLFSYWFMFCSVFSLIMVVFAGRPYGFNAGLMGKVVLLQNILFFVVGFFILKRKEWARIGVIVLTAASLFLTMAYMDAPYFKGLVQRDQIKEKQHQKALQRSLMERMDIENANPSANFNGYKTREMIKEIDQKARKMEHSSFLIIAPFVCALLWFLLVYFFFTRPKIKEQFTWDPDIGKGGRFLIRFLALLGVVILFGNAYLIQMEPRQNEIWRQGMRLMSRGNNEAAVKVFDKGISIFPGNGHLYASRGIAYRNRGEWQKAFEDYNKALWFDPENQELYLRRGYALDMMGEKDKALQDYNKALELDPFYVQALIDRSLIYFWRGLYDQSLSDCYLAIKEDPHNFDGQLTMGCIYENMQRPLAALIHFNKAIEIRPQDAHGYINSGKTYVDINQKEKALEGLNKAIVLDPRNPDAYRKRGDYWFVMKDYLRAAQDDEMVFHLAPDSVESRYWAMYFYYRAGNLAKVKEIYASIPKGNNNPPQRSAGFYDLIAQVHPDGLVKGYDKQEGVHYERMFKDGRLNGPARDLDDKGRILKEFAFVDGLINGSMKVYQDGKLDEEWTYQNDMTQGITKQYFPNGKLKCTWTYENDKANGPAVCYNADGKLESEANYQYGFRNGAQKAYYPEGALWSKENYVLGELDGRQEYFDHKGVKTEEDLYDRGTLIKREVFNEQVKAS